MSLAVVIPTFNRFEKLANCIASVEAQVTDFPVRIHAIEDVDHLMAFGVWNKFLKENPGTNVAYICDDTVLRPNCLQAAWNALTKLNMDGLVGFHQANIQGKSGTSQSAMGIIGTKFADRYPGRQVFCPLYTRFVADDELGQYARKLGKFIFCTEAQLDHYHPAHYKDLVDETHNLVREPLAVTRDRNLHKKRKAENRLWPVS